MNWIYTHHLLSSRLPAPSLSFYSKLKMQRLEFLGWLCSGERVSSGPPHFVLLAICLIPDAVAGPKQSFFTPGAATQYNARFSKRNSQSYCVLQGQLPRHLSWKVCSSWLPTLWKQGSWLQQRFFSTLPDPITTVLSLCYTVRGWQLFLEACFHSFYDMLIVSFLLFPLYIVRGINNCIQWSLLK